MLGEASYVECRISVGLPSIITTYLISNNNEYVIYRDTDRGNPRSCPQRWAPSVDGV